MTNDTEKMADNLTENTRAALDALRGHLVRNDVDTGCEHAFDRLVAILAVPALTPSSVSDADCAKGWRPDREAVARIIDPEAHVSVNDLVEDYRRTGQSGNMKWSEEQIRSIAQYAYDQGLSRLSRRRDGSLAKADAILALAPPEESQ